MEFKLYQRVALKQDVERFRSGDVATLIDFVQAADGTRGAVLEVFDAIGKTIGVLDVSIDEIVPIQAGEVLSVRRLA